MKSTTQVAPVFVTFSNLSFIFSPLSPFSPEGILAFRTLSLSREENKVFHNVCMFTAVILVSLGLYAVFQVWCRLFFFNSTSI